MRPDLGVGLAAAINLFLAATGCASAIGSAFAIGSATARRRCSSSDNTSTTSGVCCDRFLKSRLDSHNYVLSNGMDSC